MSEKKNEKERKTTAATTSLITTLVVLVRSCSGKALRKVGSWLNGRALAFSCGSCTFQGERPECIASLPQCTRLPHRPGMQVMASSHHSIATRQRCVKNRKKSCVVFFCTKSNVQQKNILPSLLRLVGSTNTKAITREKPKEECLQVAGEEDTRQKAARPKERRH